jgi:hypothetical protein
MLIDDLTAPSPAYTLRTASSSVQTHTRSSSVSTRVCSCTSLELVTLCAIRNCRQLQEMNENYEQLNAGFACNRASDHEYPSLGTLQFISMALAMNTHILKLCNSSPYIHPAADRASNHRCCGAVSTQYWISVDRFSTRLNASVQKRQGEVIQGLSRPQAIHFLDQNFTSVVMRVYLDCHSEEIPSQRARDCRGCLRWQFSCLCVMS